ncbi:MAG: PBP1A family penicillin-binding protein [Candidatus Magasanikbacteria bacterium]
MNNNKDNSRTYGFVEEKTEEVVPLFNKKSLQKKGKKRSILLGLLFFPFKILKFFWDIFFGIIFKGQEKKTVFKKLFLAGTAFAVFSILFLTLYTLWISRDLPDPDKLQDRPAAESTKIYDRTGEHILYEIYADKKRTIIEYEDIPQDIINAVVATEDTKYYEHHGVRFLSILRSIVMAPIKGRVEGTSTLTQQLVKNAILTNERSIIRKLKEIILSLQLERRYNKQQILKIYFNEIPYGSTNYGLQSAAQAYFGKNAKDLELHECATLAGLPQAPTAFLNNLERFKQRRDFVLRRMYEEGYITEAQKNDAQAKPFEIKQRYENITAPHFVMYVKQKLVEKYGENVVDSEGLKVITSLDYKMQEFAEKSVKEQSESYFSQAGADNTALVAMNPQNGQILAMVGSRDFFDESINGQFNVATLGVRQPGSSFKPIIYAAAFEKGYTPETVVFDVETNFAISGKPYIPRNYDLGERGPVTLRKALQGSLNIPAVKTMYLVGEKKSIDFATRLGYTTFKEGDFGLSLVLGGGEVKLIDHVTAYSVFANNGLKNEPVSILRVEDRKGKVLDEWKSTEGERVLDKNVAATISNVLSDDASRAYIFGAGGLLTIPGYTVAAKTGTTNSYVDAWTVGYTPNLVTAVWVGNTDNTPMNRGFGGSSMATPIWHQFMKNALKELPQVNFPAPPLNTSEKAILRGSNEGGVPVKINSVTGKIATSSTPENLIVEKIFVPQHCILHYVVKDDPQGPFPENPASDPQYAVWEAAIQNWIERQKAKDPNWNISFEEPPTEYDDAYSLELLPTLEVVYPKENEILTSRELITDIRVSAPRGVSKVIYFIDGKEIATVSSHPYNLNYFLRTESAGSHTLKITAEDDIGNRLTKEIPFTLQTAEQMAHGFWWASNKTKINREEFPAIFFLELYKKENIKKISVRAEKESQTIHFGDITSFDNLFNGLVTVRWDEIPSTGNWTLIAESYDTSGTLTFTDRKKIQILEE